MNYGAFLPSLVIIELEGNLETNSALSFKAVVTGASKGIGLAICKVLATAGYHLAMCSRGAADLDIACDNLLSEHPTCQIIKRPTDLSTKKEVEQFTAFIRTRWQHIDVLVNNAGVYTPGEVLEEPDGALEHLINTNLYSAYYLTRQLIDLLRQSSRGHIFNMCSVASLLAYPNGGSYSISKFALLGFTKVLREELKQDGIAVTAIIPGATWSASWAGVDMPSERLMQASDVAESVISALNMSDAAVVEEIILRPRLGDL